MSEFTQEQYENGNALLSELTLTDGEADLELSAKAIAAAERRGAERERAAVVAWLRRGLSFDARAEAIEAGKHREEE